jgi:hypothetical protein
MLNCTYVLEYESIRVCVDHEPYELSHQRPPGVFTRFFRRRWAGPNNTISFVAPPGGIFAGLYPVGSLTERLAGRTANDY